MPPLRVAYIVPPRGTLGPALRAEIDALRGQGLVRVFVYGSDGKVVPGITSDSSDILVGGTRPGLLERATLLPKALRWRAIGDLGVGSSIAEWVLSDEASVFHLHTGAEPNLSAIFARRLSGLPLTVTINAADRVQPHVADALADVDRVFASSRYGVSWLRERGIAASLHYPSALSAGGDRTFERKGGGTAVLIPFLPEESRFVVDALHRLDGSVSFWIAGDTPRSFRTLVKRGRLTRRVAFFDELLPVERPLVFGSCDLLCMPALPADQDLPYEIVLAMSSGKPVVAPAVRGLPEVVKGPAIAEPTGKEMAEAIRAYTLDTDRAVADGARNRKLAVERFGPGNVDKLRTTFHELSGEWVNG